MTTRRGFSVIELMIVVMVIGIIASIAMPSYHRTVVKTRRTDARVALTTLAQRLERCRTQYGIYDDAACPVASSFISQERHYTVGVERSPAAFALTATPRADQAGDEVCGTFRLDHRGERSATGSDAAHCW